MPDQIYIGNFSKGLKLNRTAFNIDNDAFPTLYNFYCWRGRVKRKRGTSFLGQLQKQEQSVTGTPLNWQVGTIVVLNGAGNGSANLISVFGLEANSTIVPGSIEFTDGPNTYTEPNPPDGTLVSNAGPPVVGTINYATGAITITAGSAGQPLIGFFSYYPRLPVMGLRDFTSSVSSLLYPLTIAFDTKYAYQINQTTNPVFFYDITYYKGTNTPFVWSGQNYQQFWTTNYPQTNQTISGAFWATNNKPGFHFVTGTYSAGTGTANITFNFQTNGNNYTTLIIGDKLFFNEWSTGGSTINGLVGTVSNIAGAAVGNYIVTFDAVQTVGGTGIAQLLTNSITGQDGIKWYDGDPTAGTGLPTGTGLGWVNFAPPLTDAVVSINDTPTRKYYLVGALAIVPFKDRLLFFSPYIQAAGSGAIQLTDVVIWSWNGTPFYNALVPFNQTFDVSAYYVDQTGKGGWLSAGISQPIITISNNEDVLLVGFGGTGRKTRFVYTSNDLQPFLFFNINSELPSTATFSSITLDRGALDIGQYGLAMTDQQSSQRIDLDIPDSIFQIQSLNNGYARVSAIRDFFNEWIYFSYPVNNSAWVFPTQSFFFNYRDNTWAIFYENFTTHGRYRAQSKRTWQTLPFKSWQVWQEPWNTGAGSALYTQVIGGNPQGYVLIKDEGTGESVSGDILAVSAFNDLSLVTSPNHCVRPDDYLYMQDALGLTGWNGLIGKVLTTPTADTFTIDILTPTGTYLGLGRYVRLSQPLMQTKQFPVYWQNGRQVILGTQKYLLDYTDSGQVTLNIYLSQDPDEVFNDPTVNTAPNSLEYSQILYTCPESTNLGLTPANVNLQTPTAQGSYQIWHRVNTSLKGDTVQLGITLSDTQMRNLSYATDEIALHGVVLNFTPGPILV
ncbi:hypothetical protein UFOVP816_58 [uncultured Caudovirales phage]|uniref:Uncharacterized protein n=1 Tax=uncultured Caudovirales phage TaxID=2100421 RepID=A0A6J5P5V3_9CAUD|nr:hypothetical protein UFOVP816_58 [uncultured Caudovirales phage]